MSKCLLLPFIYLIFCAETVTAQYSWQMQYQSLPAFSNPVELVPAYDGTNRMFVVQLRGIIYVFENDSSVSNRKVFLDLSDRVSQSGGETGLLGLAFHPLYPDSPYFYVNYTSSNSGSLRSYIARYTVSSEDADSALHNSEEILLSVDQPYSNHNGGKLAFGPDGCLYIGFGDGGSSNDPENRAQDRRTLLGKILRINVDSTEGELHYSIPVTNPYYDDTTGFRKEIYAYGIRNPWKFSFDPIKGTLWLGDVGQDLREEIDTVINGGNYGWRLMEGNRCTPAVNPSCNDTAGLLHPIYDYPNLNGLQDGSITGGYIYRGSAVPSLYGKYIYGDYVSGRTFFLTHEGTDSVLSTLISDEAYSISTFGVDTSNNIYLCSYSNNGRIYKLVEETPTTTRFQISTVQNFQLFQNYPNPFNPSTKITFTLSTSGNVMLSIFNILGENVAVVTGAHYEKGTHTLQWTPKNISSGVYFAYFAVTNEKNQIIFSTNKKLVLMK